MNEIYAGRTMKHKSKLLPANYNDATQRQVAKAVLLRYRPEAKPNTGTKKTSA